MPVPQALGGSRSAGKPLEIQGMALEAFRPISYVASISWVTEEVKENSLHSGKHRSEDRPLQKKEPG